MATWKNARPKIQFFSVAIPEQTKNSYREKRGISLNVINFAVYQPFSRLQTARKSGEIQTKTGDILSGRRNRYSGYQIKLFRTQ